MLHQSSARTRKYRCEDQAEECHAEHAEEHSRAKRLTHFSARAGGDHQWNNAENESRGCHQDRSKACLRGLHDCIPAACALRFSLLGKLDDQDCVFCCQTYQHDEPDLRQNVPRNSKLAHRCASFPITCQCPLWVKSRHMPCDRQCPLYPRKRTCAVQLGMPAKGQKRTSRLTHRLLDGPHQREEATA
jgi:hypothetical protein